MRRRWRHLALMMGLAVSGCEGTEDAPTKIRFWAMGREGEVVQQLMGGFEREHPGIHIEVQQIPWSAAHEKLLTAFVGRSTPDLAQLGNTWIAEFVALRALEPLDDWVAQSPIVDPQDGFAGIWDTNVLDGQVFGVPWYVDTRVLFYRSDLLAQAGYEQMPRSWAQWQQAMERLKETMGPDRYPIFLPINEWNVPVILGLQAGSTLLDADHVQGAFRSSRFREAFHFYVEFFRKGLAPPVANNEIANLYQEFERGYLAMYVTGPWNLGEFRRRLRPELQNDWATSPLPGPDSFPGASLAGGSSLVLFRDDGRAPKRTEAAWRIIEFLSEVEQQVEFYRLTGDLPASRSAWDSPALREDRRARAFYEQLQHVVATPKIPEWEQIATRVLERAEQAIRGAAPVDSALAGLDRDVDRILEKRRWLLERDRATHTERAQ